MRALTVKTALVFGILAMVLPGLSLVVIWMANLDIDYGLVLYGATVALAVPTSLLTGLLALWNTRHATKWSDRWQAWAGLVLGLLATFIYVLGGLAFLVLLDSVLRHD
jgi:phosphoglycerol transferase MdoB-like AlkP superfamily enzyme